ncbi:MAG TPA: IPT/TIG domain-containing protein [Polyangia bacterium]|nr:IPT/TIG domain-containing protein [Polyangia bacterium]
MTLHGARPAGVGPRARRSSTERFDGCTRLARLSCNRPLALLPLVLVLAACPAPKPHPLPTITSLSPSSAAVGSAALTLTVRGSGLVSGSVARWSGADRPTTFVNEGELTVDISAADLAAPADIPVTVFAPAPGGGVSSPAAFHVLLPAGVPAIFDLAPIALRAAGPDFTLGVIGSGFNAISTVLWNGAPRPTTFRSETELEAAIPAADIAGGGYVAISVYTPPPGGGTSESLPLQVENPTPLAVVLMPASAAAGQGGLTVGLRGRDFVPGLPGVPASSGSIVLWNGAERPTTFLSPTQLQFTVPASDLVQPGDATVTVINPPPGGGASTVTFTTYVPVNLTATDLASDTGSGRLYAAVPASAPSLANTVAALDPVTGSVLYSVPVGNDPGLLALSDNGQFLYVGLRGLPAVRRIDVAARAVDREIALGTGPRGESLYAGDLEVLPGAPHSIAVARSTRPAGDPTGQHGGVVIYDDGTARPVNTLGGSLDSDRIAFADSASLLYGVDNLTTTSSRGPAFLSMTVNASGVSVTGSAADLIDSFDTDIVFAGGLMFTSTGPILDPVALTRQGTFDITPSDTNKVVPDVPQGRVYYLQELGGFVWIDTYDLITLARIKTQNLSAIPGPTGSLVRWGPDGLAYHAGSQIVLLRAP